MVADRAFLGQRRGRAMQRLGDSRMFALGFYMPYERIILGSRYNVHLDALQATPSRLIA
jgi:hypothetical protein